MAITNRLPLKRRNNTGERKAVKNKWNVFRVPRNVRTSSPHLFSSEVEDTLWSPRGQQKRSVNSNLWSGVNSANTSTLTEERRANRRKASSEPFSCVFRIEKIKVTEPTRSHESRFALYKMRALCRLRREMWKSKTMISSLGFFFHYYRGHFCCAPCGTFVTFGKRRSR